eukprot:4966979-Pleurochrysis_carterae.AAC.1
MPSPSMARISTPAAARSFVGAPLSQREFKLATMSAPGGCDGGDGDDGGDGGGGKLGGGGGGGDDGGEGGDGGGGLNT